MADVRNLGALPYASACLSGLLARYQSRKQTEGTACDSDAATVGSSPGRWTLAGRPAWTGPLTLLLLPACGSKPWAGPHSDGPGHGDGLRHHRLG
jgi:hypothetical protein